MIIEQIEWMYCEWNTCLRKKYVQVRRTIIVISNEWFSKND